MNETPITSEQTRQGTGIPAEDLGASKEHIQRMIDYAKSQDDYSPAPDELRDAWINDADAGSCEGEEE